MTNMKRAISDSDSEGDYDDTKSGSTGHGMDRKKRRGVIEKRRRDRINNSLSELRRLVPAAFEKQGSAKLEKAEILQMTVDHLKCLHAKGLNGYNIDTAALAIDYRSVGFRECVAEVARYMVTVEGMDIQDPLRLRLLSHLQCYSAQREAAAKASLSNMNSSWGSHHHHHHSSMSSHYHSSSHQYNPSASQMSSSMSMISHNTATGGAGSATQGDHGMAATGLYSSTGHVTSQTSHDTNGAGMGMRLPATGTVAPQMSSSGGSAGQVTPSVLSGLSQVHSQFPVGISMNSMPMLSPSGANYSSAASSSLGKPYRPWGAELAY